MQLSQFVFSALLVSGGTGPITDLRPHRRNTDPPVYLQHAPSPSTAAPLKRHRPSSRTIPALPPSPARRRTSPSMVIRAYSRAWSRRRGRRPRRSRRQRQHQRPRRRRSQRQQPRSRRRQPRSRRRQPRSQRQPRSRRRRLPVLRRAQPHD
ncbi:hypothetical protein C8Q74DRAFT_313546 [Fomes fomentarius]|nr:hypothetical protein C8Q74DRAFT_313546 [Fomes fomentarius]